MSESRWSGSGGAGGGGDVFGPVSSTNNSVPRFDGTAGDTLQDSGIIIDDSDNVSGVNDLDAATITLPGGGVQTQLDEKIDGPTIASSTDNAIVRWDGTGGRAAQNSTVTVSDVGVIAGATIDGDDNTVRDLALSTIKTVLADANEILRRDVAGVVVSGPATVDADGNLSGLKTITVRNDDDLSGASAHILRLDNHNNAPGSHPFVDFQRARAGNTNLQNGDEVGGLDFRPRFNGNTQTTAKIQVEYTGNGTTRLSDIVFQTSNGSTPAERMRIAADGKVTIAGDFEVQGTTTTINTTNLEVEDKNITVNFGGTDASATGAGLTVEGTGGLDLAAIQYDATLGSKWKVGASGSEDEVVTRTLAQTLTNKTINGSNNTITNVSLSTGVTGTLPITNGGTGQISKTAAFDALSPQTTKGDLIAFDGADAIRLGTGVNGQVLSANSSATSGLEWVDAPTAGGFINYITNPSAESSTTGWATYADAAAATPADGTGGSPNVTWTRNTSSPIRGNADFAFAKDAANRQGQGVAFAFTLATTDRSKKCQITFDYDTSAANYAAGDLRVYIYDVTNAALITPQTVAIPKGTNTFQTTFDTTTSTSYRLILHVATTNATAYTVDFDNFVVNAGQVVQGAAISEWQSYTPTGSWSTNVNYSGWYRRTGSSMDWRGKVAATATLSGATQLTMTLPLNLTVTSSGLTTSGRSFLGKALVTTSGATRRVLAFCYANNGSNNITFEYHNQNANTDTTLNTVADVSQTTPFTMNNGDFVEGYIEGLPIAEWAGSGTVNLGPGAQVEYASTSGTWNADSSTTVYGPAGQAIGGTLGDTRLKTVTWQYPIQADDMLIVEGSKDQLVWFPMNGGLLGSGNTGVFNSLSADGTVTSGVYIRPGATNTQTIVAFGRFANFANDDSPANDWPSSQAFWRVRKAKASSPVGFGMATATDSGLVPSRETGTYTATATGAVTGSFTVTFERIGNRVTLQFPGIITGGVASGQITLSAMPSTLRPTTANIIFPVVVTNAGSSEASPGGLVVNTDGTITIGRSGGTLANFTNAGNQGLNRTSVSYLTNGAS